MLGGAAAVGGALVLWFVVDWLAGVVRDVAYPRAAWSLEGFSREARAAREAFAVFGCQAKRFAGLQ